MTAEPWCAVPVEDGDYRQPPQARPYSKEQQLGAGRPKRYRRKVAGPKQWAAIREEKLYGQPCRVCGPAGDGLGGRMELHHLVPRGRLGDDVADNLVPVHRECHKLVEVHNRDALRALAESLTDGEYAYCIGKLGEGAMERLFGVLGELRGTTSPSHRTGAPRREPR